MTPEQIARLECLKLAEHRQGANDPRPVTTIAEEYFAWVLGDNRKAPQANAGPKRGTTGDGPTARA